MPCWIRLIAHAPNLQPGRLEEHSEISSGVRIFRGDNGGVSGRLPPYFCIRPVVE